MDLNLVVLRGRVVSPPEVLTFDSGSRVLRLLVAARSERPRRRIDVLPVSVWDPEPDLSEADVSVGGTVWVTGAVQRRFSEGADGSRSRIEIVAEHVRLVDDGRDVSAASSAS